MREKEQLLMDEGFHKSALPGLVLATTVLPFRGFITTTGTAFSLNKLSERFEWFSEDYSDDFNNFDALSKLRQSKFIGELLKICFEEELSENIEYRDNV